MECSVCLDDATDRTELECGHSFCRGCILGWCRRRASCPLCKRPVPLLLYSVSPTEQHCCFFDLSSVNWEIAPPDGELGTQIVRSDVFEAGSLVTRVNDILFPTPADLLDELLRGICDGEAPGLP